MNDTLIVENMNLVYHIVQRDYPRYASDDDIIQCGMLGLVKAAKNYDPTRGVTFAAYARKYVHGEIRKELKRREKDKAVVSLDALIERGDGRW